MLSTRERLKLQSRVEQLNEGDLKKLRDDTALPYNVRRAASNLLNVKQVDGIRKNYLR